MAESNNLWESELWFYLNRSDGTQCPLYDYCQFRKEDPWCLSDELGKESIDRFHGFIDDDEVDLYDNEWGKLEFLRCWRSGRIFQLIRRLAWKYRGESWDKCLPVPDDLISVATDTMPIEVRLVPLRAYRGAIWRLNDCWLIHLNSRDTRARQRFTLYHEIFHILAHCKATPVFRKTMSREGIFNEMLADYFSAGVLLPSEAVKERWASIKDVGQMAAIFEVPESIMYISLVSMRLI